VVIVIAARSDLRDGFHMANEAFALSPISARAMQPGEEDYAAISEAFMETSRGRWFLAEYAKRNRNADTRLVLDAVARLEESLAAQRQAVAAEVEDNRLEQALAAIRDSVAAAQASAMEAFEGLALEQKLAPVRKGARVIREIAWRLREIGNDGRICDLIDSQVAVIENGAAQISSDDAKAALAASFATLAERLAGFGEAEQESAAAATETTVASPAPAPQPAAEQPSPPTAEIQDLQEAPAAAVAEPNEAATPRCATEAAASPPMEEAALAEAEAALADAEAAEMAQFSVAVAANAHDEAVLDMVAMEMGAADEFDIDDAAMMIVEEAHIEPQAPAEPEMIGEAPEMDAVAQEPVTVAPKPVARTPIPPLELSPPPAFAAPPEPARETRMEVSLGSTIIASGIVKKPGAAANDPLAPIRRMSQAEKIAFFS
jgi:hypothetical protein